MLEAGGFEPKHDNGLPVEELGFWKRQYIFAAATMPAGGKGSVRYTQRSTSQPHSAAHTASQHLTATESHSIRNNHFRLGTEVS